MPPGFRFCRPCWRELPAAQRIEIWTASSRAHFKQTFPDGPHRLEAAMKTAVAHLRQHGTSLAA